MFSVVLYIIKKVTTQKIRTQEPELKIQSSVISNQGSVVRKRKNNRRYFPASAGAFAPAEATGTTKGRQVIFLGRCAPCGFPVPVAML